MQHKPRIHITSDGTGFGSRVILMETGREIHDITRLELTMGPENSFIPQCNLTVIQTSINVVAELAGVNYWGQEEVARVTNEADQLRDEIADLKKRLEKYEGPK